MDMASKMLCRPPSSLSPFSVAAQILQKKQKKACNPQHLSQWRAAVFSSSSSSSSVSSPSPQRRFSTAASPTLSPKQLQNSDARIFVHHTFYKTKTALSMHPGRPIFKKTENGGLALEKEGSLFMEFAPSTGPRQYDWSRKQVIALSATELGGLIGLTTSESAEFFHDPHMGTSDAGTIRKTLKVEGMPDKTGFFFNMTFSDKKQQADERFSLPITKAEFAVMRSSFNFIIPYLMGWHAFANPSLIQLEGSVTGKTDSELEWAK